ncbi:MAG: DUF1326 domain-containing protein [Pseudomonadota bacterium]
MAETDWHIEGEYFETCNCAILCPCLYTNLAATPTEGDCKVAMVFDIARGHFGALALDGLKFVHVTRTPHAMGEGDWTVGVIVDEAADDAQCEAIVKIAKGEAGGPMALVAPFVGTFAGVERRAIRIEKDGLTRTVAVPERLEQGVAAYPSARDPQVPIVVDNTAHPANDRLALARVTHSRIHAFGIDWDNEGSLRNGHIAPFDWRAD